jgi:hypothetical protein
MTSTANAHIDRRVFRAVPYARDVRRDGWRKGASLASLGAQLAVTALALGGCSNIIGFRDVTLEDDANASDMDGRPADAPVDDALVDAPVDAPPDAPAPRLWAFVTNASFAGGFGSPNGARVTADIKCADMYDAAFTNLGCTEIHAVIQVDDTVDSLARMDINFPIPQTAEVLRATDATPIATNWDAFINPNQQLLAPVVASSTSTYFWSGRGIANNLQCTNWTSSASSMSGNAGDATKVNGWMSQANFTCNNFNQRLLCICW